MNFSGQLSSNIIWLSGLYRFQEDEGLGEQVTEEVVVGQSDALKVSGGVDLLKQLRELRLQHIHLETQTTRKQLTQCFNHSGHEV